MNAPTSIGQPLRIDATRVTLGGDIGAMTHRSPTRQGGPAMTATVLPVLVAQAAAAPPASGTRLVVAALVGIALIVVLITRFKVHPFLALTIGSLVVAGIAGLAVAAAITSYLKGFGDTAAGVGTLIALGAMFGKLLADSGGGDQIADTIIGRSSTRTLPWAMALVGALSGCRCSSRSASCC